MNPLLNIRDEIERQVWDSIACNYTIEMWIRITNSNLYTTMTGIVRGEVYESTT